MPIVRAASSMFRCESKAAMAASFLRPNFDPCPVITCLPTPLPYCLASPSPLPIRSHVQLGGCKSNDTCQLAEIDELRPRPGHLQKPAASSIRRARHHEMPFAVEITHRDEGLPAGSFRLLLPGGFQTLQPFPYR